MHMFILLLFKFNNIKELGWIKSLRKGPTGIGYTFESLLGKTEDALCIPDFYGIEIKTHRLNSNGYICLFNYNPLGSSSYELKRILMKYGYISKKYRNKKVISSYVYCNYLKSTGGHFKFSLYVDYSKEKVFLSVYDENNNLLEREAYWDFCTLKEKLYNKLSKLAFVTAETKYVNNVEFFKYNNIYFYSLRNFDSFIYLLKISKIRVSFFATFDIINNVLSAHGVSFSIKPENLHYLFKRVIIS